MPSTGPRSNSSLRDNRTHRGTVGDFLKSEIQPGSHLSFVSAYFTVHAYEALASQLEGAAKLQFLFGEPSFVTGIDRGEKAKANFKLTEHGITIAKTLTQRPAAKACAAWIERMVEIRSIRQANFLHGKAYHIENGNASSAFTDLCDSFDARNANGSDMSHESRLLDSAMESIKRTFARRATSSLLSGRDGLLPLASETPSSSDDMELITWLVVMEPQP